jgi:hypothetical protein
MDPKKNHKIFLPILNLGTWTRLNAIKTSVDKILTTFQENEPNLKINILNLGAGFDTMYFLLKQKFNNFKYIEFDYKEINIKKIELIKKSKLLKNTINNSENSEDKFIIKEGSFISEDYFILDCDVIDQNKFSKILSEIPNFDASVPTIVIAECFLVYIKKKTTMSILENISKNFKNLIFIEYDLIGANDNFGREMVLNLLDRGVKLFGYEDVPDSKSQIDRLHTTGFTQVEMISMLEYYEKHIEPSEKNRTKHLELFDEFEEFNLLQAHSCFGYGAKLEEQYEYLYDVLKL